jgi:serine/threonine-protein kinase
VDIETLGSYKVIARVGAGALGALYRARDAPRGRTVTIETLPGSLAADQDRRAGFVREANASRVLSHPNVASLHEVGDASGQMFLVFDAVPAQTLLAAIGGQPMNVRRAVQLGVEIADALAEAHAHGILHRFLKPTSVIVSTQGNAKLLDFGLAVWLGDQGIQPADAVYMSPEQLRNETLDERSDIFSFGVVLLEMLTGTVSAGNRPLPSELRRIAARAMAADRDARYQSAAGLAADLRAAMAAIEERRSAGERK